LQTQHASFAVRPSFSKLSPNHLQPQYPYEEHPDPHEFVQPSTSLHSVGADEGPAVGKAIGDEDGATVVVGDAVGEAVGDRDGADVSVGDTVGDVVFLIDSKVPPSQVQQASFAVTPSSLPREEANHLNKTEKN